MKAADKSQIKYFNGCDVRKGICFKSCVCQYVRVFVSLCDNLNELQGWGQLILYSKSWETVFLYSVRTNLRTTALVYILQLSQHDEN